MDLLFALGFEGSRSFAELLDELVFKEFLKVSLLPLALRQVKPIFPEASFLLRREDDLNREI